MYNSKTLNKLTLNETKQIIGWFWGIAIPLIITGIIGLVDVGLNAYKVEKTSQLQNQVIDNQKKQQEMFEKNTNLIYV